MRQFPTTPIDNDVIAPARTIKSQKHARKTVLADVSHNKSRAVAWNTMQTRGTNMLAQGCARGASEPQYTSVQRTPKADGVGLLLVGERHKLMPGYTKTRRTKQQARA